MPLARHHDDLGGGPMDSSVASVGPGSVSHCLGEEIELRAIGAGLELERRWLDLVAIPCPPTRAGWVETPQLPTLGHSGEHELLIASADDHLDVVMLARLRTEPEVDRPASCNAPPSAHVAHDITDGFRIAHRNIVSPCPEEAERRGRCEATQQPLQQLGVGADLFDRLADGGQLAPDELA